MYDDDRDIIEHKTGGTTLGAMGATEFLGWVANKLNNVPLYTATTQELIGLVRNPPMTRHMSNDEKIRIVRKMLSMNIVI